MLSEQLTAENINEFPRSSRGIKRVPLFKRASGEVTELVVHVARGAEDGPSLGLLSLLAGDAPWGALIIREVLARTDLSKMKGTIIAVPTANALAFEQATRSNTGIDQDMTSISQVYPGDPNGTMIERLAFSLGQSLVHNTDVLVNFASGGGSGIHYTLINGDEKGDSKKSFDLSRMLGTKFMYTHGDTPTIPNSTGGYAKSLGKVVVIPELGGTGPLPDGYLETCVIATQNMMKSLGMIEGEPILPEKQLLMRGPRTELVADTGGLFVPIVGMEGLDAVVEGGTPLGRLINPHTLEEEQLFVAPYPQSALLLVPTTVQRVNPGDYLYIISNAGEGVWLDRPTDWRVHLD